MELKNNYFILRHGEARSNKENFVSSWPEKIKNPLTEKGEKQIQKIVPRLKREKIDLIFSSDLLRCKQTAEMVGKELDLKVKFDKRLREHKFGIFNGKPTEEWFGFFTKINRFKEKPKEGENWTDVKKRATNFLKEIDKKYKNKNILIISHQDVLLLLLGVIKNLTNQKILKDRNKLRPKEGELIKL